MFCGKLFIPVKIYIDCLESLECSTTVLIFIAFKTDPSGPSGNLFVFLFLFYYILTIVTTNRRVKILKYVKFRFCDIPTNPII